jgi:hypothetical protein
MDLDYAPIPEICRSVGLSCKNCTQDSATSLASICKGLKGKAVNQLFYQIYPVKACSPMRSHFARSYRAASKKVIEAGKSREADQASAPCTRKEVIGRDMGRLQVSQRKVMFGGRAVAAVA